MHEGLLSFGAHVAELHPVLVLVVLPGGWGGGWEVLVMFIDKMTLTLTLITNR